MPVRSSTKAMSPIAPSRSSFEDVPSSWTVTLSRLLAHFSNAAAKRVFVTRWISSATSSTLSQTQSSIGRPPIGSSCFAIESVSGRSRVAYPAARMIAFMHAQRPPRARATRRRARGARRAR